MGGGEGDGEAVGLREVYRDWVREGMQHIRVEICRRGLYRINKAMQSQVNSFNKKLIKKMLISNASALKGAWKKRTKDPSEAESYDLRYFR